MPLSTNKPNEMIRVAKLIRSSFMSLNCIMLRVASITKGTIAPTIRPVRSPKNKMTTTSTMAKVCRTLTETPLMVLATWSAW